MKQLNIVLRDSDVQSMNDETGDIVVSLDVIQEPIENGDNIIIHYEEDAASVDHEYVVTNINAEQRTAELAWKKQITKTALNEANPLQAIKNKLMPDEETKLKNAEKAAQKKQNKLNKKAVDLYARDIKEGQNWNYYLQLPDGSHIKTPLKYNDIKGMYNGSNRGPWIVNAVVTTPTNFIVRRGKEDLDETGTLYKGVNAKLQPAYTQDWTDTDKDNFKDMLKQLPPAVVKNLKAASKSTTKTTNNKNTKQKENDSTEEPVVDNTTEQNTSNGVITDKLLDKFVSLVKYTGLQVLDSNMKPVQNINEITPKTASNYYVVANNKDAELDKWLESAVKNNILTESSNVQEIDVSEVLVEAPVIKLNPDELNNPEKVNFADKIAAETEKEAQEKARAAKEARQQELKKKYNSVIEKFYKSVNSSADASDTLEVLFNELVPRSGEAASVAGEYVRAMMRLLYRDYNDGDKFFEGYGLETCGSSAEYLLDHGFAEDIQNILENGTYYSDNDDAYTDALNKLTKRVIETIKNNNELIYTENEEDSRNYSYSYIEEHQPRYDYEIGSSDELDNLVDNGTLTSWDLVHYVENELSYDSVFRDAVVERPWGYHDHSVTVSNLTRDGLAELEQRASNTTAFWESLIEENADNLTSDSEDEDNYDDEF